MKKILTFVLITLCLGCSNTNTETKTKLNTYFLFATPLKDHPVWLESEKGFSKACKELNVHCEIIGPNAIDTEKMNQIVLGGIAQKANGIITQGVIDPALLEEANQKGIPIILIDSDMENSPRYAYMGKNFTQQANLLLDKIEKAYGKDELLKISIQVAEAQFTIAQSQIQQLESVLKNHPGGYEIINVSESKSDSARSKREWKKVFTTHQDVNVAINFAGESAQFCFEAANELGLRKQMLIFGVDEMDTTINLIKNGDIDGSIVTSFYNYGYESVQLLYKNRTKKTELNHETLPATIILVDKNNVSTYKKDLQS